MGTREWQQQEAMDIIADLAELYPYERQHCLLCDSWEGLPQGDGEHKSDCIWARAKKLVTGIREGGHGEREGAE